MGISGMFLRKINGEKLSVVKKELIEILNELHYSYYDFKNDENGKDYCIVSIDNGLQGNNQKSFVVYLYGLYNAKENWKLKWINNNLRCVIDIEDIKDCNEMIIEILHRYMKLHPDTIYYTEMDWFYTKEDIDKNYAENDHINWKYKTMKLNK